MVLILTLYDIAVLGCGWAGILLTYFLSKAGYSTICIEKNRDPGGLLKSEFINGFTVDIGGSHIIFSRDESALKIMLGNFLKGEYVVHQRRAFILLGKTIVPYPLENGLYILPPSERAEALISFLEALLSLRENWRPRNLEEWIYGFFGRWFAEKYLAPYNKKLWKRPLKDIDVDWIYTPGRLPIPDWREVVRSAVGIPTHGYIEQARFYYPLKGGIQALFNVVYKEALNQGGLVLTSLRVEEVRKRDSIFEIKTPSKTINARRVVNTIPIPDLLNALNDPALEERAKLFDYNRVLVTAVAINKEAPDQHWIYNPSEDIVFHRYIWISNYSPYNAPRGKSLLITETTIPKDTRVSNEDLEKYTCRILEDLEKIDVVKPSEVLFVKSWLREYGYPIHKHGLAKARRELITELEQQGIISVGRWGKWKYLNMDMVLKDVISELSQFLQ